MPIRHGRPNLAARANGPRLAVTVLALATGCSSSTSAKPGADAGATDRALMDTGLNYLYKSNHPDSAAEVFRQVLQHTPSHYGAQFQLARALDAAGKPEAAREWWLKVQPAAQQISDSATLELVSQRLAHPDTLSQLAMMNRGLTLLYQGNEPAAAAAEFRKVLQRNPGHYGARFQLAKSLDAAGNSAEAHQQWEQVLRAAESIRDRSTADTARSRLVPHR